VEGTWGIPPISKNISKRQKKKIHELAEVIRKTPRLCVTEFPLVVGQTRGLQPAFYSKMKV